MNYYLKSVISKLTDSGRQALDSAISIAVSRHHAEITTKHILLALIQQETALMTALEQKAGLKIVPLLDVLLTTIESEEIRTEGTPVFSPLLIQWLTDSWLLVSTCWDCQQLPPEGLLASLLTQDDPGSVVDINKDMLSCATDQAELFLHQSASQAVIARAATDTKMILNKYTRNISEQARQGQLDPVLGRETEIRQMIDILLRRRQNNPLLTGEPGVGKTALVEGLALQMIAGKTPQALGAIDLLELDLTSLLAGASVKGEFEKRLQELLKAIKSHPRPTILFVDEAHMLIGAGGQSGQSDAANLLKPALARGTLRLIAATTWSEYKKYLEKDPALTRRFQLLQVKEPDIPKATCMLRGMVPAIARHHQVTIMESAVNAAVVLSQRYISDKCLPDKSISLLDTACARVVISRVCEPQNITLVRSQLEAVHSEYTAISKENATSARCTALQKQRRSLEERLVMLQKAWQQQRELVTTLGQLQDNRQIIHTRALLKKCHQQYPMVYECVDDICVADVIADWTGIPLGRVLEQEQQRLKLLCDRLRAEIIGQEDALTSITSQIEINRAGLSDPGKPAGVFLLAGPSGTGKTQTALMLAKTLYGGEQNLVTINMSEFQEAHTVSGLKGAPPGYIGYGQGGRLTEAVRRTPYCVLLLDEVEKAHPDVMGLFYQIFDKGKLEDAEGRIIDFCSTFIIMTSNLGSDIITQACHDTVPSQETLSAMIHPQYEQLFSPALMGRITLIPYLPLQPEGLFSIVILKLNALKERYQRNTDSRDSLKWSKQVTQWIVDRCSVQQRGARDIDQIIAMHLLPRIANHIANNNSTTNIKIGVKMDNLVITNASK